MSNILVYHLFLLFIILLRYLLFFASVVLYCSYYNVPHSSYQCSINFFFLCDVPLVRNTLCKYNCSKKSNAICVKFSLIFYHVGTVSCFLPPNSHIYLKPVYKNYVPRGYLFRFVMLLGLCAPTSSKAPAYQHILFLISRETIDVYCV